MESGPGWVPTSRRTHTLPDKKMSAIPLLLDSLGAETGSKGVEEPSMGIDLFLILLLHRLVGCLPSKR